jgi:periplasmic protein TonB
MKTKSISLRAATITACGLLATLSGCTNVPLAQSTIESSLAPMFVSATQGNLEVPVPLRKVPPVYPFELKRAGITGNVSLSAIVDENGRVRDAEIVDSSDVAFRQPALDAVRQWTFQPARRNGESIAVRVNLPIHFNLTED